MLIIRNHIKDINEICCINSDVCYVKVGDGWSIYYVLIFKINVHPSHILCPRCVSRKVGINELAIIQECYCHQK